MLATAWRNTSDRTWAAHPSWWTLMPHPTHGGGPCDRAALAAPPAQHDYDGKAMAVHVEFPAGRLLGLKGNRRVKVKPCIAECGAVTAEKLCARCRKRLSDHDDLIRSGHQLRAVVANLGDRARCRLAQEAPAVWPDVLAPEREALWTQIVALVCSLAPAGLVPPASAAPLLGGDGPAVLLALSPVEVAALERLVLRLNAACRRSYSAGYGDGADALTRLAQGAITESDLEDARTQAAQVAAEPLAEVPE